MIYIYLNVVSVVGQYEWTVGHSKMFQCSTKTQRIYFVLMQILHKQKNHCHSALLLKYIKLKQPLVTRQACWSSAELLF